MNTAAEHRTDTEQDTVVVPRPALLPPPAPHGHPAPPAATGFYPYPGMPPAFQASAGFAPSPFGPQAPAHAARPGGPRRGLGAVTRTTWIALAATVALVAVMIAVIVVGSGSGGNSAQTPRRYADSTTSASAAPADPGTVLGSAALPTLLLDTGEIAGLVGKSAAGATVSQLYTNPAVDTLTTGPECLSLAYPGEQATYQGSGFTGARLQYSRAKKGTPQAQDWVFNQAAFAYPTAAAAKNAVFAITQKWKVCEGKSWGAREVYDSGPRDVFWTGGTVQASDDVVGALIIQENGDGWGCMRGLSVVANVVNDVAVCGINPQDSLVAAAAAAIAKKAPTI
jgi:hypothetical protein